MTTLMVPVPDGLVRLLGSVEAAREHLRRPAVLDLVERHVIAQGRGAERLGMSPWDFRDLMAQADVPLGDLTEGELKEGHRDLRRAEQGAPFHTQRPDPERRTEPPRGKV